MTFGTRLERLIEEKNISKKELAEELEVSQGLISGYVKDTKKPSFEMLLKLAEYFNVSIDYLMCKADDRNIYLSIKNMPPELFRIGVEYISLAKEMEDKEIPPEDIKKIIDVIKNINKK